MDTAAKNKAHEDDDNAVEVIHLDNDGNPIIEDSTKENDIGDNATKINVKTEVPRTAKDLFTEFRPDSPLGESQYYGHELVDDEEQESSDDEIPLSKRIKIEAGVTETVTNSPKIKDGKKKEKKIKKKLEDTDANGVSNAKKYPQKYKKEWEEIPSVKPWLSMSVHGETYFYCKFCKKDYKCGKSEVFKHMASMKHKKNCTESPVELQKVKFTKSLSSIMKFRGLLCPVVTPFEKNRTKDIAYHIIRPYVKFLRACGVKGVLVNDILGEGMSLTITERKKVLEEWTQCCKDYQVFLMVQIGGTCMKNIAELAQHAEQEGVGAVVVLPDLYNRPKDHLDLVRYVKTVSHSTGCTPILYHHYPKATGLNLDMKKFLLDITGEVDTFVGLIYSTGDLQETVSVMELNPEKFVVFMGTDEGMLGAAASGIQCIMANSLNMLPKLAESVCTCMENAEIKSAQASQALLTRAMANIESFGELVPTLKAAMSIITNLPMDVVRDPLQNMWEGTVIRLKDKLREIGII